MSKKAIMAILAFFALLTIIAVVGVEAQPIGNETLGIAGGPTEPSSHGAYGTAINFLSLENPIVFSIEQDGWTSPDGLGFAFYTIGIRVDDGTIYRVTESNRLDRTLQQMGSYNFSRWVVTNYHVTDFYNVTFSSLSAGEHQVTVYLGNVVEETCMFTFMPLQFSQSMFHQLLPFYLLLVSSPMKTAAFPLS